MGLDAAEETVALGGDAGVARVFEFGVVLDDGGGFLAGQGEQVLVVDVGDAQDGLVAALGGAEDVAFATHLEVDFGELEAVAVGGQGGQPLLGALGLRLGHEQAVALVLAAADASAELVELGEAEPVGAVDEHDGGVGDVDADFDDGGGDEDVELGVAEAAHHAVFFAGRQAAVHEADAEVGEDLVGEAFVLVDGGANVELVRLLDQRADHKGLAAGGDLLADEYVCGATLVLWDDAGEDFLATGREFVDG